MRCLPTALLSALAPSLLMAAAGTPAAPVGSDDAMLSQLRAEDLRVATIAFRLQTRGRMLCPRTTFLSGLLLHDAAQYAPRLRAAASRVFGLAAGPAIEAVVPGSPAAAAGLLAGDRVVAVNGAPLAGDPGSARRGSFAGMSGVLDRLDAALAPGAVTLDVERDDRPMRVVLTGTPGCPSRVQLVPGSRFNDEADGTTVSVTSAMMEYVRSDDELAFILGHELSHDILGHRARLEGEGVLFGMLSQFGANAAHIRAIEEEADYLGVHLMAAAGYDPNAAAVFFRRLDHDHGHGILSDATHLNGATRVRFLALVADDIRARATRGEPLRANLADVPILAERARRPAAGPATG